MIEEKLKKSRRKNLFMGKKLESSAWVGYSNLAPSYCSDHPEPALRQPQKNRDQTLLMQSTFVAGGKEETFDEEFMSFLASPKVEEVKAGGHVVSDPNSICFQPRSKAVSTYSLRSKT
mmetsp:Transcript_9877/g.7427  ORF Transcript_9877/g.7427 Transcript_9877/m.7427 type:complete len:118 (-) Transcript_9877:189-542(-)